MKEPDIIRSKWIMDGANTLSEAAVKLRAFADELEQMEREGWQLTQAVADDYGFILKTRKKKPKMEFISATGGFSTTSGLRTKSLLE